MREEFNCLLALSSIPGIGSATLKLLLSHFKLAKEVCAASEQALLEVPGIKPKNVLAICAAKKQHKFDTQIKIDIPSDVALITYTNKNYPPILKTIYDPPPYLFARGNLALLKKPGFAIVGTRKATHYGIKTTTLLSTKLSQANFTIVSGMAEGIDSAAHRAALEITGKTIAVLGSSLDIVYPAINRLLYQEICQKGLVLSEFLPGTSPTKYTFPKRNRIIAGLSQGVLLVEGSRKSGAMITVDFALEQGRDVFAIPGRIDNPMALGPNWIIQHGAKLVYTAKDILEEYGISNEGDQPTNLPLNANFHLDAESKKIIETLSEGEQNIELLSRLLNISIQALQAKLTMLELKGIVKRVAGRVFGLS